MGQPYSDADLIIQHSNKMPNSENFRALKMEFIDCDVSQFSTARPSLTHNQPNPQHLRSARHGTTTVTISSASTPATPRTSPSLLSLPRCTSPDRCLKSRHSLEAMMRRIISEYNTKYPETIRPQSSQPSKPRRMIPQAERDAYNKGRQDARMERPPYQDRPNSHATIQFRDQSRYNKPPQTSAPIFRQ